MIVKELIEKLKEFDPELRIIYDDTGYGHCDIASIKIVKHDINRKPAVELKS